MTVYELIQELAKCDADRDVSIRVTREAFECSGCDVSHEEETYLVDVDAFDAPLGRNNFNATLYCEIES